MTLSSALIAEILVDFFCNPLHFLNIKQLDMTTFQAGDCHYINSGNIAGLRV